jgi:uncharacterized protein (DUF1330 family)
MITRYMSALSLAVGIAIGATAIEALRAQVTPSAYTVTEIDISDLNAYKKEYVPLVQASIKAAGGHLVAAGQNIVSLDGEPPKTRITINQFDSLEKVQAWRNSAQYKEARAIGDKYAKFRAVAFDALPQ